MKSLVKCAIGQDSHAFSTSETTLDKPLILGGVQITELSRCMKANSDGDVILHALTNAISGITCHNILGSVADEMCAQGVTDSREYLRVALQDLQKCGYKLNHISLAVECKQPRIAPHADEIRASIASLCGVQAECVGITATSGEGLTPFGQNLGISVFCIITVESEDFSA